MENDKETKSELRTQFAEDRTLLASERTFAGWMRTSLGCVAIGIGLHALFSKVEPGWVPRAIATLFLGLAAVIMVLAERRACAVTRRLSAHVIQTAEMINLRAFTAAVTIGSLALVAIVWTMPVS